MKLTSFVINVLTLATTGTAFHPWFPEYLCLKEGTCKPQKRSVDSGLASFDGKGHNDDFKLRLIRRETKSGVAHSESIARVRQLGTRASSFDLSLPGRSDGKLVPRATITAQTPTQSYSAGVYQDGGDDQYFAEVMFGSNKTPLLMLLDSGGSQTWIKSSACTSSACINHKTFGSANSSTLESTSQPFSISYGSGNVNGTYVTDSLSFAGLDFRMEFGLARFVSDTFLSFDFDGILGLAQDTNSFIDALVASKELKSNIFGVSLSSIDDGPNTSEISFGAPDTSKFTGNLAYSAVNASNTGYWTIHLDNAGYGNTQMGSLITTPVAYIDTGTTYMFAPEGDAQSFYSLIPGSQSTANGAWTVPCATTTPLTITFSGVTYSIPAKDWVGPMANGVCISNLYLMSGLGGWLLGDVYLRQVYTVFDVDAARIGFAPAIIPSSVATSATSTSTATGTGTIGPISLSTTMSNATPTGSSSRATGSGSKTTSGHPSTTSNTNPTTTAHSGASKTNAAVTVIMAIVLITAVL